MSGKGRRDKSRASREPSRTTEAEAPTLPHSGGHSETRARKPAGERHLWEFPWVRDLALIALLVLAVFVASQLLNVLIPLAIAFGLAYAVEPVVRRGASRFRLPRFVIALVLLLLVGAGIGVFSAFFLPRLVNQVQELSELLPGWSEEVLNFFGVQEDELDTLLDDPFQTARDRPQAVLETLSRGARQFFGAVGRVIGVGTDILLGTVLVLIGFLFFSAKYPRVTRLRERVPARHRDTVERVLKHVDASFSGFLRGQLVVALCTGTLFAIGWGIVGVPYWIAIAVIGGIFSLIPYGQSIGWVLAVIVSVLEAQNTGGESVNYGWVIGAPTVVYLISQALETWVITPWVQGGAVRLHPMVVLICIIIGGTLFGIWGIFLAVPVTASVLHVVREFQDNGWKVEEAGGT